MRDQIPFRNEEDIDVGAFCAGGFASYTAVRIVDGRPSIIYLWLKDGDGLALSAEPVEVSPRLEVGVIRVAKATKSEVLGVDAHEVPLPREFLSPTTAFSLQVEADGFVVENGLYLLTKSGGELQVASANYPHALSFKIETRSKDYEPEYFAPDYRYAELAKRNSSGLTS